MALVSALVAALYFAAAGRVDLPLAWACLALMAGGMLAVVASIDRELLQERLRPAPGGIDRRIRALILPFFVAHLVVAGLDARYGWSAVPTALGVAGLVGMALSMGPTLWAMRVNRFFSPVVRIQSERGHPLVTDGPYGFIRHPGYLGALAGFVFGGLALGSWWALLPLSGGVFFMLRRTVLEDRYLRENLPGYADYVRRVRYRLVPGVW